MNLSARYIHCRGIGLVFYVGVQKWLGKITTDLLKTSSPASFSYPLKRSLLDVALYNASVKNTVYSVRYLFGRGSGPSTLDVMFQPENGKFHASVSGRCLITLWAVPSDKRKQIEDVGLVDQGLPLLCQWLEQSFLCW